MASGSSAGCGRDPGPSQTFRRGVRRAGNTANRGRGGCTGRWRRRRDSNPRYGFRPYNGLANRRLQPLGHLSERGNPYRALVFASTCRLQRSHIARTHSLEMRKEAQPGPPRSPPSLVSRVLLRWRLRAGWHLPHPRVRENPAIPPCSCRSSQPEPRSRPPPRRSR